MYLGDSTVSQCITSGNHYEYTWYYVLRQLGLMSGGCLGFIRVCVCTKGIKFTSNSCELFLKRKECQY